MAKYTVSIQLVIIRVISLGCMVISRDFDEFFFSWNFVFREIRISYIAKSPCTRNNAKFRRNVSWNFFTMQLYYLEMICNRNVATKLFRFHTQKNIIYKIYLHFKYILYLITTTFIYNWHLELISLNKTIVNP